MIKYKTGDWIEFNDSLRDQSYRSTSGKWSRGEECEFLDIDVKLRHNQTYDINTQYGGFTDDSIYTEPYQFIVITYDKPYEVIETKDNEKTDGYSLYFINEYGVRIHIPMTEGKNSYIKLSNEKK